MNKTLIENEEYKVRIILIIKQKKLNKKIYKIMENG